MRRPSWPPSTTRSAPACSRSAAPDGAGAVSARQFTSARGPGRRTEARGGGSSSGRPPRPRSAAGGAKALPSPSGFGSPAPRAGEKGKFAAAVAKDLAGKRGAALVIPGERQTALTHAVAHAINAALGAIGTTVTFTEPAVLDTATGHAGWQGLVEDLRAGKVDTLVITAWNPVFTAP